MMSAHERLWALKALTDYRAAAYVAVHCAPRFLPLTITMIMNTSKSHCYFQGHRPARAL